MFAGYIHGQSGIFDESSGEWPRPGEEVKWYDFKPIQGTCRYYDYTFSRVVDLTNNARIEWLAKSMNSNSFAYTALKRAGLTVPISAIPGHWWQQLWGWGNQLPIGV